MKRFYPLLIAALFATLLLGACGRNTSNKGPVTHVTHPEWTQIANIYEVNVRQYTPEGTLAAFNSHLDRLANLGIDILWFMPMHPIGEVDRKGPLGSYYSVKDYKDINPEFGTVEDFKQTVALAHQKGMKVMLDWVANHTSRDHAWITQHPDWYVKDSLGAPLAPFDWDDVAQLDTQNPEVQAAMLDALKFWVEECSIDGYRCDVAWNVEPAIWDYWFRELRELRPDLFFLAEAELPELQENAFNAYYGWEMHHLMNKIAQGEANALDFAQFITDHSARFPAQSIQLNFTSNHDENSWSGTEFERMGAAADQMAALTFAFPGMPLIYTGQETGLDKRLEFFQRDPITWDDPLNRAGFYKELIALRDAHPALHWPTAGGALVLLKTNQPEAILAFERTSGKDHVICLFNFAAQEVTFTYKNGEVTLPAHGYQFVF